MKTSTQKIQETLQYKLVCDEARELSWKLQNTIYVIYRNNSLITSMSIEDGELLCSFSFGNQTIY
jgi:hypothetical protein